MTPRTLHFELDPSLSQAAGRDLDRWLNIAHHDGIELTWAGLDV